jgi:hypothetical protein
MYTILDKAELLTFEEIKKKYDGKWVFMTNCEFSSDNALLHAIPRVVADKLFEGKKEGIYDIYSNKEVYGEEAAISLIDFDYLIKAITFLPKGGVVDEPSNVLI